MQPERMMTPMGDKTIHYRLICSYEGKSGITHNQDCYEAVGGLMTGAEWREQVRSTAPVLDMGGDNDFAIGPVQVAEIVQRVDAASDAVTLICGGSDSIGPRVAEVPAIDRARRSIHARVDIPSGAIVRPDMLMVVRPSGGIDPWLLDDPDGPVGKHTTRRVKAGSPVTTECFYRVD